MAIEITQQEQAVAAAVEQLRQAMVGANREVLTNIASESLTYGHSDGQVENKAEFVENIAGGHSVFVTIQLSDAYIKVEGDIAVTRHTFTSDTNNGGVPRSIKLHILLVWRLEGGEWKLLVRQAVRL
jgi:hypothetical protein